jgi:DNA-binding winged helix-turn-helix (wHTH) protein/tetratricopeptide (TPR) repeat protein
MQYFLGPLVIDGDRLAVLEADRSLQVAPKVVEVLVALCEHAGSFVAKEALRERLWPGGDADDTALWQKVYLARKMLAPYFGVTAIETLARRGYRLTVEVHTAPPASAVPTVLPMDLPAPTRAAAPPRAWLRRATITASAVACMLVLGVVLWNRGTAGAAIDAPTLRAYNLGRYFLSQQTYDGSRKAMGEFATVAASRIPDAEVMGYTGLADAHDQLSTERSGRPAVDELRLARDAARTALRLNPRSGEAMSSLGAALLIGDRQAARGRRLREDETARTLLASGIALRPNYALGHHRFGEYLFMHGDAHGAAEQFERAIDLDPSSAITNVWLAHALYDLGDSEAAARYARRAMAFGTSDQGGALTVLGYAYERLHHFDDARRVFHELAKYHAQSAAVLLAAYADAELGARAQAKRHLDDALRHPICDCGGFWMNVALAQLKLGDRVAALTSLKRMARRMHGEAQMLDLDPRLAAIRSDPRLRGVLTEAFGA